MIINNGFTVIENIDTTVLNDGEFRLFIEISKCCFGEKDNYALLQSTMAEKLKVCVRTIQRRLKSLVEKGFLSVKRRGHKSSIYTILKGKVESSRKKINDLIAQSTSVQCSNVNNQSKKNKKKDLKFNNFTQRTYDYDSLEKQLLGWNE